MSAWRIAHPGEKAHLWVPSYDHPHFDEALCDTVIPAFHSSLSVIAQAFDPDLCCAECYRLSGGEEAEC